MSSSLLEPPKKPERYHHGDLKNALLDAARDLATEVGVDNFTLREVARRAGVSPAAPYHHFEDKNDLVRALALHAFKTLTTALQTARDCQTEPIAQLEAIGLAFVRFAFTHHAEFRFMFRRELCAPPGMTDPLEIAGTDAQKVLFETITAGQSQQLIRQGNTRDLVLTLWSVVHGLSTILLETPLSKTATLPMAEAVAKNSISDLLRGIQNHQ